MATSTRRLASLLARLPAPRMPRHLGARALRGRRLWSWIQLCSGLVAVAAGAWWVTNSPLFDMRSLSVSGNARVSRGEIQRLSGLDAGTNVLWLSPRSVEQRLLVNPWIEEAHVSRSLPGHVSVLVKERSPTAVLHADAEYLVAGDGTILARAPRDVSLPTFRAPAVTPRVGASIEPSAPEEFLVLAGLPTGLRGQVKAAASGPDGVELLLRASGRVLYGDAGRRVEKGRVLASLLAWLREHHVRAAYLDVRIPGAPAVRPAGSVAYEEEPRPDR